MKKIIIDSSSIILLYKCGMLDLLLGAYRAVIPGAVFDELTIPGHDGAEYFREICIKGMIEVAEINKAEITDFKETLHRGEREVIALYRKNAGDFIVLDDGRGGAFCRENNIPYINALLAVKILFIKKIISETEYTISHNWLISNGRYSEWVINFAERAGKDHLSFFV